MKLGWRFPNRPRCTWILLCWRRGPQREVYGAGSARENDEDDDVGGCTKHGRAAVLGKEGARLLEGDRADTGDSTLKSDQEPAMKVTLSQVSRHRAAGGREGRTVIKHSAVEDSKGNGVVERVVKSIEGQTRVARSELEMRIGAKIEPEHAVMTWLIEYVSLLVHR